MNQVLPSDSKDANKMKIKTESCPQTCMSDPNTNTENLDIKSLLFF